MQNGSLKCTAVINLVLKIHDGGQQKVLNGPILHHHGFLILKFLTAMHFRYAFGVIVPNFVEIGHTAVEISRFCSVFLVKYNFSLDDCTKYSITLSK